LLQAHINFLSLRLGDLCERKFGIYAWKQNCILQFWIIPRETMSKILLVEDNEMNRDMLSRRLERKEFEVVIAVDGQAGVNMAGSESPDLILMDLSLPVIDGWEATRQIKANPATQTIPLIALTAHAMAGDEQKALEAGCDDYDTKPVNFTRLLGKIEKQLGAA